MKKIFFAFAALLMAGVATAQVPYESIVERAKQNSTYFKALDAQREAAAASAYATPMLENPEVEFGYYNGHPSDVGRRWDLSASQTFEMPNVYANRSKLRKSKAALAGVEADFAEIDLVKEIQMLCSEAVYQRDLLAILERCKDNADEIAENYSKRMDNGDCSILEYNRARMEAVEAQSKFNDANVEYAMVLGRLSVIVQMGVDDLKNALLPYAQGTAQMDMISASSETLYSRESELRSNVSGLEVKEARAELLPKVSVGYASENVVGETFRGATVGLELPLWRGNRGVKAAKAASMAEQSLAQNKVNMNLAERQALSVKIMLKKQIVDNLKESISQYGSIELLRKSLDGGQMTLEEYLLQMDFYIDSEISVLDAQKELDQAYIEYCAISK